MSTFRFGSIVWMCVLGLTVLLHPQVRPQRVRISEKVSETFIANKVQPSYPEDARKKHIQGSVVMQAEISKTGEVESLRVISGDPVLATAAIDAVKQWKYKPYLLNGQPIAVETQVTVRFMLETK
jgi:protein TonB